MPLETAPSILGKGLGFIEMQIFVCAGPMHVTVLIGPGNIGPDDPAAGLEEFYGTAQVLGSLVRIRVIIERREDGDMGIANFLQGFLPFRIRLVLINPKADKDAVIR